MLSKSYARGSQTEELVSLMTLDDGLLFQITFGWPGTACL